MTAPDPQTVREDDDAFCPHTAYPLQITLTLIEGDMTVRHTECGRTVLTDWPYLRAHDVPLTLAYATDDQDEDWLELRLPAGLDEWLQEDEQQPADVVTAEQQQDGAAEDVAAFLGAWEAAGLPDTVAHTARGSREGERPGIYRQKLNVQMLRAVLAERTAPAARVAELTAKAQEPHHGLTKDAFVQLLSERTGQPVLICIGDSRPIAGGIHAGYAIDSIKLGDKEVGRVTLQTVFPDYVITGPTPETEARRQQLLAELDAMEAALDADTDGGGE